MAYPFAVVWGMASGILNVAFAFMWPTYHERLHLASIRAVVSTFSIFGTAIGPAPSG